MNGRLLQNSLIVASSTALLAGFLGGIFALFSSALDRPWRNIALGSAIAAFVLPPFLVTNTWLNYFGLNGVWRSYLNFDLYSLPGTILLISLQLWPVTFLLVFGSLLHVDRTYLEQEPLLRGLHLIRYLAWPACRMAAGCAALLTFVLALNNFTVPALLQVKVFSAEVWLSFLTKFDYAEALRLSWPLLLAPLILLALLRFTPVRWVARSAQFPTKLWRSRLTFLFPIAAVASGFLLLVSLCFPLAQLVASSRTWTELLPAIEAGKGAAISSLTFAIPSALLVVGMGLLTARSKAGAASWLFFLIPGVLIGIALIRVFNRPMFTGFYNSFGIVLLAFGIRYFALGWGGARAAFALADSTPREAIKVLGGSRWQQFALADWPQMKGLIAGTFFIVYLLCLWEVETLILIVPPGRETLAVRVFNMLHYGHAGQVDALCVWMLLLGLAPLLLFGIAKLLFGRRSILLLPLLLAACGGEPQISTKLNSKLFSSVQVFGSRGTGAGQFNKPRSIAVDRQDNFYVVDMTGRVQKFTPEGQFVLSWQMPQTEKGKPKGMACDSDGNIIVVEPHYSRVNHFTTEGKLLAQWGVNGTNRGQLFFPRSAAVDSHGDIYLSEYGMVERIQHFSHLGTNFIGSIGQPGTGPGDLNRGEGIGIAPDDTLFEADSCNHRVQVFTAQGKLLTSFGLPGAEPGQMSYPYDVRVDPLGYRFVCEFGNSRVQIFDAQNHSFEILGGAGTDPGQMNNPWAIALDSRGNLYVADALNHRVQKFIRREPLATAEASARRAAR